MIERITILGGSSVYTPELIQALISSSLEVQEVVLLGKGGRKLEIVARFCQRLLKRQEVPLEITVSTDPKEAIRGARYILNNIRVGGMKARMRDEVLPAKFGMLADENLGAGGFSNAFRSLPAVLAYARLIEKEQPDAVFINVTNPIGMVIDMLVKETTLHAVGVCDLPVAYTAKVARILDRPPEEIFVDYIGLNQLGWIQDVKVNGCSRMRQLLEILETTKEPGFDHDLIKLFRMIPTRNTGLLFHRDKAVQNQQAQARVRAEVLYETELQILQLYDDEMLDVIPDLTRERQAQWYENSVVPLIAALEQPEPRNAILCVQNKGFIRDLPEDSSVEISSTVSSAGIQPRKAGSLPRFLRGLLLANKDSERLTVEAVLKSSYSDALQALTINPFVPSLEVAKKYLDRVIKEDKIELH